MGKDSAYYNDLEQKRRKETEAIKAQLPIEIRGFIDECLLNYQSNTALNYARDILFFFRYIKDNNPIYKEKDFKDIPFEAIANLMPQDINEYQNYVAAGHKLNKDKTTKPVKESAKARKMASVRNLFKYLIKYDYLQVDPTQKAIKNKKQNRDRKIKRLNAEQVDTLITAVSGTTSKSHHSQVMSALTAKRDLAIFTLLLNTGMRVSECAGLDVNDLDLKEGKITIVRKGGFEDYLYLKDNVIAALIDYLENERQSLLVDKKEKALFISLKHRRLSVSSIQCMVKKYGQNAGLAEILTPHKLRRTYGTALYNKTGDIYLVADVLGHKDVNTTVKHYADIEEEHKKQAADIDVYE